MNEQVLKMIDTLHARLDDVEAVVKALPFDQPQFAKQLDKVDDRIYLIQCEIEKLIPASANEQISESAGENPVSEQADNSVHTADQGGTPGTDPTAQDGASSATGSDHPAQSIDDVEAVGTSKDDESEEEGKPLISDEMKDNLKDAGRTLGGILKDSKDVVSELSGTVNDLKSVFKFK